MKLGLGIAITSVRPIAVVAPPPVGTIGAPDLALTSSPTAYPPTASPTFYPADHAVGMTGRIAVYAAITTSAGKLVPSGSATLSTTFTLSATPATNASAINAALAGISSGAGYVFLRVESGSTIGDWSVPIQFGTSAVPTLTSSLTPTAYESVAFTFPLTLSGPVRSIILRGQDTMHFELVDAVPGSTFALQFAGGGGRTYPANDFNTDNHYDLVIEKTGLNGVITSETMDITLAQNRPAAFSFTPVTNATRSTPYVGIANAPISGIGAPPLPISVSGGWEYSIDGGTTWATAPGTVGNGPTPRVRLMSSASYSTPTNATLNIGNVSATYTVTTLADPAQPAGWATSAGPNKYTDYVVSGSANNVATQGGGGQRGIRAIPASASGDDIEYSVTLSNITSTNPIYIGVDNGTTNLLTVSNGDNPAGTAKTAFFNAFGDGGTTATWVLGDAYAIFQQPASNAPSGGLQNGDIVTVRVKKSTGAVRFFHKRGAAAEVQVGTTATISGVTNWYARLSASQPATFTANFSLWGVP